MTTSGYLLLATASVGMLLNYLTRATRRGSVSMIRLPFWRKLLSVLALLFETVLFAWAFAAYPWYVALIGLLFFSVVFSYALAYVAPEIGRSHALNAARPMLEVAFIMGSITLWWKFFPL